MSNEPLVRYVLGTLPPDEAEKLDERSITDAEFAAQVKVVEHDLADAYVRGELSPEDRRQWEAIFLASPEGRDQLRFATALASSQSRRAATTPPRWSSWTFGLAAAAAVAMVTIFVLFGTSQQPVEQPIATNPPVSAPPAIGAPPATSTPNQGGFVALTLMPATRSTTAAPVVHLSPAIREVRLTLRLDPNDFQQFRVEIRTLAGERVQWRSSVVAAAADADRARTVTVPVPADQLQAGRFLVLVSGIGARGDEIVGTYPMDVKKVQ